MWIKTHAPIWLSRLLPALPLPTGSDLQSVGDAVAIGGKLTTSVFIMTQILSFFSLMNELYHEVADLDISITRIEHLDVVASRYDS